MMDSTWDEDIPPPSDEDNPNSNGHSTAAPKSGDWRPIGADSSSYIVPLSTFAGDEEPDEDDSEDWLIRDMFPRAAPCLFGGPPKASKSIAMLDSAIAVARGEDWLGLKNTAGPRRVHIAELEDNVRPTRIRLWKLCKGRGIHPRELDGMLSINAVDFCYPQRPEDDAKLRRSLDAFKPDLVYIDSLRRSLIGNENDSEAIAAFGRVWLELCRDYGTTICVVHHLKKNPTEGESLIQAIRGSGDIVAIARHIVGIRRMAEDPNLRSFEVDGNYTSGLDPFAFALVDGEDARGKKTLRLEERGPVKGQAEQKLEDDIYELVLATGPMTGKAIEEEVTGKADRIRAALKRLVDVGRLYQDSPRKPYLAAPRGTA